MKNIIRCFILSCIVVSSGFFFQQCTTTMPTVKNDRRNLAFMYNPSMAKINPVFKLYHKTDNISKLMVKIDPDELLFNQANKRGIYLARIRINYHLMRMYDDKLSKNIVDSATYIYEIEMDNAQEYFMTTLNIPAKAPHNYMMRIFTTDLLRKRMNQHFIEIDKSTTFSRQNFNVINANNGVPIFKNVFENDEKLQLLSHRNKADSLFVKYFINNYPLPPPTFSVNPVAPVKSVADSVYKIPFYNNTYILPRKGIYHFQFNDTVEKGISLFNFGEDFPQITTASEMIKPMAYLTNSTEYKKLLNAQNKKLALDNFWLSIAKNTINAKELIRIYYNRVVFSNQNFTSDKEGWKTDRGMVYIIYGPPHSMHKSMTEEKWMYFEKRNQPPVEYVFKKRVNRYTGNDYILVRSDKLSVHWQKAIKTWRNGRVYIIGQ